MPLNMPHRAHKHTIEVIRGFGPDTPPHSHRATLLGLLLTLAGNLHPKLAKVIAEHSLFTLPLRSHTHIHSVNSTSPLTWPVSSLKGLMGTGWVRLLIRSCGQEVGVRAGRAWAEETFPKSDG